MEGLVLFLGIVCCLQVGWNGVSAASVHVSESLELKPGEKATLECLGSEPGLSFYIKNRIAWQYVDLYGRAHSLTYGFYPTDQFKRQFDYSRYSLDYGAVATNLRFRLNITAVQHADDGVYRCALLDEQEQVTDSKDLTITVLHRVQTLKLELVGVPGAVSTTPLSVGDRNYTITPGTYKVRCTASGSNPSPVLTLKYNEAMPYVSITSTNDTTGERMKYTGSIDMPLDITVGAGMEQTITCEANVPNKQFPTRSAGLRLQVIVQKPEFECKKVYAQVGNKYRKLDCVLKPVDGAASLTCNKVHWLIGDNLHRIPDAQGNSKVKDDVLDVLEAQCESNVNGTGLQTTLTLYTITEQHFDTEYSVEYGMGEEAHRHPVVLNFLETSGSSVVTPLSLLVCVVTSIFARHLAKL